MQASSFVETGNDSPSVNGTDGRVAHPKRWLAALVQINSEKKVSQKLNAAGICNFVPTQTEIHQWSDRNRKVDRVVIPMVVFVYVDEDTEKILRTYSFIYRILSYPGERKAAVIPEEQIENLKFMLRQSESRVEISESVFRLGEKVKVVKGPLCGLCGELCRIEGDKPMVAVRVECLGYACVQIPKSNIMHLEN